MAGKTVMEPIGATRASVDGAGAGSDSRHLPICRRRPLAVLLAAAVMVAAVVAGILVFRSHDTDAGAWVSPERRLLAPSLRELGRVVAQNETTVFSQFSGEIIWMIDEGTFVEPGTIIIRFDATKTQESVELKQKDLIDRKSVVRDAQREVDLEKRRGDLEVARLEAELSKAKLERQDVYSHPTDDEKGTAELDLKAAQLKCQQAQRDFDAYVELYEAGYASRAMYKQKQLKLATQKAELAKARVLHQLALQGKTAEDKRLADLAVAEAEKNLATGRFDAEADLKIAKAGLELSQIALDNFQKDLDREVEDLDHASVKAPVAGRVAFIDVYKGSRDSQSPIQVGENRSEGQDLCKISDTSALQIKTAVSEMDVDRLRVGQEADVRLPALPGKSYRAKVASVELVAKDKNATLSHLALQHSGEAFVNVVGVLLDFENVPSGDQDSLRLGLTAEVSIRLDQPRPALAVPWTAVRSSEGRTEVLTRNGLRPVRLGESDDRFVEILEGLSEGEEVHDSARPVALQRGQP